MGVAKTYGRAEGYENKLTRVMERLGVQQFTYDYSRQEGWVQFTYKGEVYRFEHTVEKSKRAKEPLRYGSDCFAQVVLTLEDLARMVERGIYDLQQWAAGMKLLPEPVRLQPFLIAMGFTRPPADEAEVKARYRELSHFAHPDRGGTAEQFHQLTTNYEAALKWLKDGGWA